MNKEGLKQKLGDGMGLPWIFKKLLFGNAFAAERGRIRLFGRMDWTLVPSRALARNLQSIGERLGERYVYKLGYQAGKDAAEEIVKYMGLKPRGGWITQKAVLSLLEFIGFGKPEFIRVKIKDGRHHIIVHVRDNPVIEHGARLFGAKSMVCKWFMGVYAAHGEMELGVRHVRLRENKCVRLGDRCCEWETKWPRRPKARRPRRAGSNRRGAPNRAASKRTRG